MGAMAVDEPDVPRTHSNGQPNDAVASLKNLHLPEVPNIEVMKREPTLIIMDVHLANSKRRKLQSYCESNGWSDVLIMGQCGTSGVCANNDPVRAIINLRHEVARLMQPADGEGRIPLPAMT